MPKRNQPRGRRRPTAARHAPQRRRRGGGLLLAVVAMLAVAVGAVVWQGGWLARVGHETADGPAASVDNAPRSHPIATRRVTTRVEPLLPEAPNGATSPAPARPSPSPQLLQPVAPVGEAPSPALVARPQVAAPQPVSPIAPVPAPARVEPPLSKEQPPVSAPAPAPAPVAAPVQPPVGAAVPGQLAEQSGQLTPWDNTGTLDPQTVLERLAILRASVTFDHARTRFPLVGRHTRLKCENCHQTTLKDTRRRCVDCHRKDDNHQGRRPNCETCHNPSDWANVDKSRH